MSTIKLKQKQKATSSQKLKKYIKQNAITRNRWRIWARTWKGERLKKSELIDIFYEVEQRFNEESAEVTVEATTK